MFSPGQVTLDLTRIRLGGMAHTSIKPIAPKGPASSMQAVTVPWRGGKEGWTDMEEQCPPKSPRLDSNVPSKQHGPHPVGWWLTARGRWPGVSQALPEHAASWARSAP